MTVVVYLSALAYIRRWSHRPGYGRGGFDKADLYELVETAAREAGVAWDVLASEPDGSRIYRALPDDGRLPAVALQLFMIERAEPADGPALVVWDVRFGRRAPATD